MATGKNKLNGTVRSGNSINLFERIVANAYKDLLSNFSGADLTDKLRRKQILRQLDEIVQSTNIDLNAWAVTQIPAYYEAGAFSVAQDLLKGGQGIDFAKNFTTFHEESIAALINETSADIAAAMSGMTQMGQRMVSQAAKDAMLESVAVGRITGANRKEISKNIEKTLKAEGVKAITDRGGRSWDLSTYGKMLARTKLTQAQNQGVVMRLRQEGNDLVIVSDHVGECDLCRPWENKILSISGAGKYPSLDKAMGEGLFHPNCRHVVSPLPNDNEYLKNSLVWDANQQKYVPFDGINNGERTATKIGKEVKIGTNAKVFRATDSHDGHADLGEGVYFAFKKEDAERYGKNIQEFQIKQGAKMLQLDGFSSIDTFAEAARKDNVEAYKALIEKYGAEQAVTRSITAYAQKQGYDGIIGDDEVFGSVLFDKALLLKAKPTKAAVAANTAIAETPKSGLGMETIRDFRKAVDTGDKKLAKKAIAATKDDGIKSAMQRLLDFL